MNIKKEQLLTISSLDLSGILSGMDDGRFFDYCKALEAFIERFPEQEAKLKVSFGAKDRDTFSHDLLVIMDMLGDIHATALAQGSFKLLSAVRSEDYDVAMAHLHNFLSSISALSIDIQMAQYMNTDGADAASALGVYGADDTEGEHKKLILAVDDVSVLLATLKGALQNTDYRFTGVTSGNAALKFLENHTPDLFILDIEMPEMDGYELAKRIKKLGQKAPIIFLTGNATTDYVLKAIQSGGSDFIVKPVNREQVLEKIRKYLG